MFLRLLSDLHMEGHRYDYKSQGEDVVLLLGDIHTKCRHAEILDQINESTRIILIAGNHEYYGSTFESVNSILKDFELIYPNLTYLDNDSVDFNGVSFFGGTMWTDFKLYGENDVPYVIQDTTRYIADYRYIDKFASYPNYQGSKEKWTIGDTTEQYEIFGKNFDRWVKDKEGMTRICLTHFLPSIKSVDEQFEGSILNGYFASNQEHRLPLVDWWFHGHTHSSCNYENVRCNPRGYGAENKLGFNPNLIIEV